MDQKNDSMFFKDSSPDSSIQYNRNMLYFIKRIDNNEKLQCILKDQFNDPCSYLNENLNSGLVIGRVSSKPTFSNAFEKMQVQNCRSNAKKQTRKFGNTIRLKKNPFSGDNGNNDSLNGLGNSMISGLNTKSAIRIGKETTDINNLNDYVKEIETRRDKDVDSKIFDDLIEREYTLPNITCSSSSRTELKKAFEKQETQLQTINDAEKQFNLTSRQLSKKLNVKQETLLINKSGELFRKRVENLKNCESEFNSSKYLQWQSRLRNLDNKGTVLLGGMGYAPIWSTVMMQGKSKEIVRKPKSYFSAPTDTLIKNKVIAINRSNIKPSNSRGFQDFNLTLSSTQTSNYPKFQASKKEDDYKSLLVIGQDLVKVEKENALSVRGVGKKHLYKGKEMGSSEEEVISSQFDRVYISKTYI